MRRYRPPRGSAGVARGREAPERMEPRDERPFGGVRHVPAGAGKRRHRRGRIADGIGPERCLHDSGVTAHGQDSVFMLHSGALSRRTWRLVPPAVFERHSRLRENALMSDDLVVVTGGGGFIGGHLVTRPACRGPSACGRSTSIRRAVASGHPDAENLRADLRLADACDEALAGAAPSTTSPPTWAAWASSRTTRRAACCPC